MSVRDVSAALALLEKRGALALGELASAIAGEPIRGSWWAHAKGKLIFNIASDLEDHRDVCACKLAGKAMFVHRKLWPPLVRVVTDPARRRDAMSALSPAAQRAVRSLSMPKTLSARDKAAIARSCILHISSEHTESGAHATVLRKWTDWAPADIKRAATRLDLAAARATLAAHGLSL